MVKDCGPPLNESEVEATLNAVRKRYGLSTQAPGKVWSHSSRKIQDADKESPEDDDAEKIDSDNDSDDDYQATQDEDEDTGDEDEAEEDDYDEGSYVKFDDDKDVGKKKGKQSKNLLVKKGKSVCSTSLNTVQYHTHTF